LELNEHDHVVECIAWAPDSALPAVTDAINSSSSGAGSTAAGGGHSVIVNGAATTTTNRIGPILVSGSRDKTIKFWDATGGLCLFTLVCL
jgi:platelet-activating factor acetylhydrolase IB subunit alpha